MSALLSVQHLSIRFSTLLGTVQAVSDISFEVHKGRILGIVGESGSGKSVTAKAILHLPGCGKVTGDVYFDGEKISNLKEKEMCAIRGKRIALVTQDFMTSLDPVMKIGEQLEEVFRLHKMYDPTTTPKRIRETLQLLNIENPEELLSKYPFECSGGMKQRAAIAMALLCEPELIIADEPTTALDVTTQMEILMLFRKIVKEFHTSIILISHDLGVITECADDVVVMYNGQIKEKASLADFLSNPQHPYSRHLLDMRPSNLKRDRRIQNSQEEADNGR